MKTFSRGLISDFHGECKSQARRILHSDLSDLHETERCGLQLSVRGEVSDIYRSTSHFGGYYHLSETYWANGTPSQISGTISVPTLNYGVDGQGRTNSTSTSTGQVLVHVDNGDVTNGPLGLLRHIGEDVIWGTIKQFL